MAKNVQARESTGRQNRVRSSAATNIGLRSRGAAVVVEAVSPQVDAGRFPVKCVVGETVVVEADVYKDGHDELAASVLYRAADESRWQESPMGRLEEDRWRGQFVPSRNIPYVYTVQAWTDPMATWLRDMGKRTAAYPNVLGDSQEGVLLLQRMAQTGGVREQPAIESLIEDLRASGGDSKKVLRVLQRRELTQVMQERRLRENVSLFDKELPLVVDRKRAEYGAWYEMFPRSQSPTLDRSGTFQDCIAQLRRVRDMGFDVLYLPPIHPIGGTQRKGPNNSLQAGPDAPGSPWAIGDAQGGHKAVHPALGTIKDFELLVAEGRKLGLEIAMDFAIQCSPDHPYVREHPDWFYHLPDGTIRYAENPPKKYQDIYPVNFTCADWQRLWEEMRGIVLFWIERGVKIFRVDNPHTKPLQFWRWLIETVRERYPDVIFLAEAFTRPAVMKYLAKAGFTQSYTYFTWRNAKWELQQYLEELLNTDMQYYFRGNFFANTPDILHEYLQKGGRPAFKIRVALAATLSSTYGIYSGFELCENKPLREGSEEYLDSEKYQQRAWDWNRAGNIADYITRLNYIRRTNPALQYYKNLRFLVTHNENVLAYIKATDDLSNIIVVVVNLDPFNAHQDLVVLPGEDYGIQSWQSYRMRDLVTGDKYTWKGRENYVRLDPKQEPVHVFELRR